LKINVLLQSIVNMALAMAGERVDITKHKDNICGRGSPGLPGSGDENAV
jgi:hypothetical protein